MQTLIMSLSLCLLGFAVCVIILALAMGNRDEDESESLRPSRGSGEKFFLDEVRPQAPGGEKEANTLLTRLRTHVRMEQAAAQAFLDLPNAESLHAPTESPLRH
jgi:hypothetical protein